MERNKIIIELYFKQKMKQKDIAEKLNVSKYIVSRVLKEDVRYKQEKERRKEISRQRNNKRKAEAVIRKRTESKNDYAILKNQHIQASLELSGGKTVIGNRAFRKWNSSIYQYNNKTNAYHLKKGIVTGFDVPKKIKM